MAAKNTGGILVYIHIGNYLSDIGSHTIYKICNGQKTMVMYNRDLPDVKAMSTFECKDSLFFSDLLSERDYNLNKVTNSCEVLTMCTGQNFAFVDGVYFNESELFINSHEMLVVKKGESIADKTVDDLMEIAPEYTMNCITKAFGRLYIFGNQGVILKSSLETGNEEAIAVQTISAKKALEESRAYTRAEIERLEARIAVLEGGG